MNDPPSAHLKALLKPLPFWVHLGLVMLALPLGFGLLFAIASGLGLILHLAFGISLGNAMFIGLLWVLFSTLITFAARDLWLGE
jgi:hypothetical protein